jgi:3-oxoacyl-[acyl-carrier-protein] synthase-1
MAEVVVGGLGAATPIGRTAWAAAAAVRAGVSAMADHSFMVDSEGNPMRVAQCPWLVSEPRIEARIADCLVVAVRGALQPLADAGQTVRGLLPLLFVNLPPDRPALPPSLVATVRASLGQALPGQFAGIEIMQKGHAGGLVALEAAVQSLRLNRADACIVAGADSYMDPDMLEWLEQTEQLHGAGPRNNAWGFIPGEGAGAVLVMQPGAVRRAKMPHLGRIVGLGVGRETNLIRTGTVCIGKGLTTAFVDAFAGLPMGARVTDMYCDMNGEPYRADEFGFAVTRTRERFISATDFVAPADCWGDVGAASAPLGIALACIASFKRYANGPAALVWASSDAGDRGAALVASAGEA